jgi:hypothetical protein
MLFSISVVVGVPLALATAVLSDRAKRSSARSTKL